MYKNVFSPLKISMKWFYLMLNVLELQIIGIYPHKYFAVVVFFFPPENHMLCVLIKITLFRLFSMAYNNIQV